MNNKKIKGLTLIESIVALSVGGAITLGVIQNNIKETESNLIGKTLRDAAKIVYAVDHRISIDGYSPDRWNTPKKSSNKLIWKDNEDIIKGLIEGDLTSSFSNCDDGLWIPRMEMAKETRLIDCKMWSEIKVNGLKLNAEFVLDDIGYIRDFDLYINFTSKKVLEDNIKEIKKSLFEIRSDNSKESSGIHNFRFINYLTKEEITTMKCLNNHSECSLQMSMNRSGSYEYLTLEGDQTMVNNSKLTFIGSTNKEGKEPLKCLHWKNESGDKLNKDLWGSTSVDCGIGVYVDNNKTLESEKTRSIAVLASIGGFENIILNEECKTLNWNSGKIIEGGKTSPCGILSDGSVLQVIDNAIAETGLFDNLYVQNAYFENVEVDKIYDIKFADIEDITTNNVSANVTKIKTSLEVLGDTNIYNSVFNEMTEITKANFEKGANFNTGSKIEIDGDLNINGNLEITKILGLKDAQINNNLTVKGHSTLSNTLKTNNIVALNITSNETIEGKTSSKKISSPISISGGSLMQAPIGEFDNYGFEFSNVRSQIDNLNSINGTSIVGQDIITVITGSWSNSGSLTNCDGWTPNPTEIKKGEVFEQIRFCNQKQKRNIYNYKNGNLQSVEKEYQTVDASETRMSVGQKEEMECIDIISAKRSENNSFMYYDYAGYTIQWKGVTIFSNSWMKGGFGDWSQVGNSYYKKYGQKINWSSSGGHGGYTLYGVCRAEEYLSRD